jgi:hypothetical protein
MALRSAKSGKEGRHPRRAAALFGLAISAALGLLAAPTRAENDFRNGFEDQLGRLLAFQAFHAGHAILHGFAPPYPHPYPYAHGVYAYRAPHPPRHWHHRHWHRGPDHCAGRGYGHGGHGQVVYQRYEVERRALPRHRGAVIYRDSFDD